MTTVFAGGAKVLASLALSLFFALQSTGITSDVTNVRSATHALALASVGNDLALASLRVAGLAGSGYGTTAAPAPRHEPSRSRFEPRAQSASGPRKGLDCAAYRLSVGLLDLTVDLAENTAKTVLESGRKPEARSERDSNSETGSGQDTDSETTSELDPDSEPSKPRPTHQSSAESVVLGGMTEIAEDEYVSDGLVCIGGAAIVRGEVRDQIVVIGGVLRLSGSVRGDIVGVGSRLYLENGARVSGDVTNVAGSIERARDVKIRGAFRSIGFPNLGRFANGRGPMRYLLALLFWVAILSAAIQFLAVLVIAAIAPDRIEGALAEPRRSWVLAFFLGAVVYVFSTLLTLVLCVLLPLGVALWIAVHVALWMGRAAIYLHVGRGIGRTLFGKELSYFGSILTGFALFALIGLVPCFGMVFGWMVSATGLGLMLLTRFGSTRSGPVIPVVPTPSRSAPSSPPPQATP